MVEKTGLEAELSVTDHIIKSGTGGSKLDIDVLTTLRNHDEFSRVVHVPDSDLMHFWQLLDDDHNEVLRGRPTTAATKTKGEIYPSFAATIPPEHPLISTHKVTIDLKKLKQGERYTFLWVLWDQYPAEQSIHIPGKPSRVRQRRTHPQRRPGPRAARRAGPHARGR